MLYTNFLPDRAKTLWLKIEALRAANFKLTEVEQLTEVKA
jgi:hypothetical protein